MSTQYTSIEFQVLHNHAPAMVCQKYQQELGGTRTVQVHSFLEPNLSLLSNRLSCSQDLSVDNTTEKHVELKNIEIKTVYPYIKV